MRRPRSVAVVFETRMPAPLARESKRGGRPGGRTPPAACSLHSARRFEDFMGRERSRASQVLVQGNAVRLKAFLSQLKAVMLAVITSHQLFEAFSLTTASNAFDHIMGWISHARGTGKREQSSTILTRRRRSSEAQFLRKMEM